MKFHYSHNPNKVCSASYTLYHENVEQIRFVLLRNWTLNKNVDGNIYLTNTQFHNYICATNILN